MSVGWGWRTNVWLTVMVYQVPLVLRAPLMNRLFFLSFYTSGPTFCGIRERVRAHTHAIQRGDMVPAHRVRHVGMSRAGISTLF